jgi:hypothetical protein
MRLSPAQVAEIEFSNNGRRDSLTGALAPAAFVETIEREMKIAKRTGVAHLVLSARLDIQLFLEHLINLDIEKWNTSTANASTANASTTNASTANASTTNASTTNASTTNASTTNARTANTITASAKASNGRARNTEGRFNPQAAIACIEQELLRLSADLEGSLRAGDYFTRFSDLGFLILMRGSAWEFELAIARLADVINPSSVAYWDMRNLQIDQSESLLHLMKKIDRLHFQ